MALDRPVPTDPDPARAARYPRLETSMTPLLTLLTDFGLDDYYVAAVKGTVLRLAPGTQLVDITHQVEPGNVAAASFLLAAAFPAFPAGAVHLAVVDPGVGSQRRILVAEVAAPGPADASGPAGATEPAAGDGAPGRGAAGAGGSFLLAPDNGLLTPLLAGARVRSVERDDLFLRGPGATFHGRERFAPVAAFLLRGGSPAELGPEIADPVRLARTPPRREPGVLAGAVVHIDRFGNLITDIPAAWLPPPASLTTPVIARVGSHTTARLAAHYDEIPRHAVALLVGSLGTLELSMRGENLARRWAVEAGDAVRVRWS
jgi:S-adenosylmethionine hydrolase